MHIVSNWKERRFMFEHFVASSLLAVVSTNALAGQKICMSIGRTEMPAFSAQNDGKIWITAPLIGWQAAPLRLNSKQKAD